LSNLFASTYSAISRRELSTGTKNIDVNQGSNFIAAIAIEGEQNAVDYCGNDGNFLPYIVIFILFTVHITQWRSQSDNLVMLCKF
jgi:hypothetical protein